MGQSLHQSYTHLVFSTKDRQPLINGEIETELYAYLAGITRDLETTAIAINGMPDHVHLLLRTNKNIADAAFIKQLKGSSSKWMKEKGMSDFKWQGGYGWFSVSAQNLEQARGYLAKQKEHHKVVSFQDEFRSFLKKCEVEYDEKYVWE